MLSVILLRIAMAVARSRNSRSDRSPPHCPMPAGSARRTAFPKPCRATPTRPHATRGKPPPLRRLRRPRRQKRPPVPQAVKPAAPWRELVWDIRVERCSFETLEQWTTHDGLISAACWDRVHQSRAVRCRAYIPDDKRRDVEINHDDIVTYTPTC
jgi:hypothetical protein